MNVLSISYYHQNFNQIIRLVEQGHTVYDTRALENEFFIDYLQTIGVKGLGRPNPEESDIAQWIDDYGIDMVINSIPKYSWIVDRFPGIRHIGPTPHHAQIEQNKFNTKTICQVHHHIPSPPAWDGVSQPVVCKPLIPGRRTKILPHPPTNLGSYYYEQFISPAIEGNVFFHVQDGEYHITHVHQVEGEGRNKGPHQLPWILGTRIGPCPEPIQQELKQLTETLLPWISQSPGRTEGQATFLVDQDEQIVLSEINTRPGLFNSLPYPPCWWDRPISDIDLTLVHKTVVNTIHPSGLAPWNPERYIPAGLMYGKKDRRWYIEFGAVICHEDNDLILDVIDDHPWVQLT